MTAAQAAPRTERGVLIGSRGEQGTSYSQEATAERLDSTTESPTAIDGVPTPTAFLALMLLLVRTLRGRLGAGFAL